MVRIISRAVLAWIPLDLYVWQTLQQMKQLEPADSSYERVERMVYLFSAVSLTDQDKPTAMCASKTTCRIAFDLQF